MVGFKTKSSTYYVDEANKTISGGYFGQNKVPYIHLHAMVGNKAYIKLLNGDLVTTGVIIKYI